MNKIVQSIIGFMTVAILASGCELLDKDGKSMLPFSRPGIPVNDDAALKGLSVDSLAISPEFDPATLEYTLYVANDGSPVTAIAIGPDGASVTATLNGGDPSAIVAPGYSYTATLNPGLAENDIVITVVSEDTLTTTVYTIRIYFFGSDAGLSSLSISAAAGMITADFDPVFDPLEASGTVHTVMLSYLANEMTVSLALQSPVMTAMVDGWAAENYDFNVPITDLPLSSGTRDITVAVTSQDQSTTVNYIIRVTMETAPPDEARLSDLVFRVRNVAGTVTIRDLGFLPDDYAYTYVRIWSDGYWRQFRFTLTPLSADIQGISATGTCITGTVALTENVDGTWTLETNDTGPYTWDAYDYPQSVVFTVTAADNSTTRTYTVNVVD
ncbi:MAG: cadherin-like beta sandwich domain-containing protein [Spirochaetes bacterium]|nr:cadherin-like beta sandwich domain-containing protein [Spirochaetota bacterium]